MDLKKIKLDKLLLIFTLIFICLYNFLSYFNSSWSVIEGSLRQNRQMGIITTGLIMGAFFLLFVLIFYLIFTKKYSLKLIVPIIFLELFGVIWTVYAVLMDKVSIGVLFRDSFPPISMMACGFLLAGYNDKWWPLIKKAIFIIACLFTFYSFYEIIIAFSRFGFEYRLTSGAPMYCYEIGLFATYGLIILTDEWKKNRKLLVFILVLLLFFNSAILQGRSWFLQTLILFIIYLFNIREVLKKHKALAIFVPVGIITITIVIFLNNIELFKGLIDRFVNSGDTRTSQLEQFFSQVSFGELLIGQGTKASYTYNLDTNFYFIDNQVLLFMFRYGIVPTIAYCYLILYPFVKSLTLKNKKMMYKSIVLIAWFAAMLGVSVYFNISFGTMSLLILLYSGRLFYEIDNRKKISLENKVNRG